MEKCYDLLVYVIGKLSEVGRTDREDVEEREREVKTIVLINVKE